LFVDKTLRIEKGWTVDRMIAEFPARQWKRRTLYDWHGTISRSNRTVHHLTDQNTRWLTCRQMSLTSLSRQTGHRTHLIWIRWIIPFGALFSSWYIVTRLRTLIIWNKSWTDAGVCSAKN